MASTILQRAETFQTLHDGPDLFVMPNPWDIGTARIMAGLGAKALATTSAGFAYTIGRRDGRGAVSRDEALAHSREIVEATDLPVSADLENGYVDAPREVAETIRLAAATGLAGASIEDATGNREAPIYDFGHAVERIAAASEAARSLSRPFTLTARAENLLFGIDDLDDILKRLQAFQDVGADVLYAPGLRRIEDIKLVCDSLENPVNLLMGLKGAGLTLADAQAAGVRRVSLGSGLARAAYGAAMDACRAVMEDGDFTYGDRIAGFRDIDRFMAD